MTQSIFEDMTTLDQLMALCRQETLQIIPLISADDWAWQCKRRPHVQHDAAIDINHLVVESAFLLL